MRIQDMFAKGIDRPINGVVKVNQDELDILVQELDEYVITRERRSISSPSSTIIWRLSRRPRLTSASGFPASSAVVNLTS